MGANPKIISNPIVFFDGVCNLCNGAVQFIIRKDPEGYFKFSSLQSSIAADLLAKAGHPIKSDRMDSIILLENSRVYTRSDAVLQISKNLSGVWKFFYGFIIIPRPVRNAIYDWVASNRYKWFGRKDSCMVPTGDLISRFLEV